MNVILRILAAIAGTGLCSAALADCDLRDATPAELQYKARVAAELKAAPGAKPVTNPAAFTVAIDE